MCSHTIQAPCNTSLTLTVFMDSKTLWPDPSSSHSFGGGPSQCALDIYTFGGMAQSWEHGAMHEVCGLVIGHAGLVTSYTDQQYIAILSSALQFINSRHSSILALLSIRNQLKPKLNQSFQKDFFYNHYGLVVYNHCLQ